MTRDQFLAKQMGVEWHDTWSPKTSNPDYTKDPADILALQQWVMDDTQHKDFSWDDFCDWAFARWRKTEPSGIIFHNRFNRWLFSDPDRFADLVAEFRGWRNEAI